MIGIALITYFAISVSDLKKEKDQLSITRIHVLSYNSNSFCKQVKNHFIDHNLYTLPL